MRSDRFVCRPMGVPTVYVPLLSMMSPISARPYRSQNDGKAERFIETAPREWGASEAVLQLRPSDGRPSAFQTRYNERRHHTAISDQPPLSRLGARVNNVLSNHT